MQDVEGWSTEEVVQWLISVIPLTLGGNNYCESVVLMSVCVGFH